ncbi:MAG: RNA 2',3'-cyclic phosphodiesterase [Epsilonproteobacteria bacterium]|nr:MAG: RNA 2',3'-cyclic phosphodiesterase [Campylobacterota bacterium]
MIRIFIALDLPADIKDAITSLKSKIKGAKWANREQMHLTLRFIGEVTEFKLKEIVEALDQISYHPFSLKLKGVGHFSSKVLWVGVVPCEELEILKDKIEKKLLAQGFKAELKNFKPHITLARLKGGNISEFLEMHSLFESSEITVEEFILYSSNLTPSGAIHTVESKFCL